MFDSALELITQAASNSVLVFCFCNLIIAVILLGSKSKPGPNYCQERQVPRSTATNKEAVVKHSLDGNNLLVKVSNASDAQETSVDQETGGGDKCNKDCENDEFRRKVEEFIDKVNRGWKAESLRTSYLV